MHKLRKTRFQQLHLIITIIGALVVTGICLYIGASLYILASWVSITIVSFYLLGQVVRLYLEHVLKREEVAETAEDGEDFTVGEIVEDGENVTNKGFAEYIEDNADNH